MQKRVVVLFFGFLASVAAYADEHSIAEINSQIWQPFIESYATGDGDLHASLYSPDIVRISRGEISTGSAYIERMRQYVNSLRARGGRSISFRFTERTHGDDIAYETGVFRIMRGDGSAMYGQFEVVIRNIGGEWKLTLDHDKPTNQMAWDEAEPMEPVLIPTN